MRVSRFYNAEMDLFKIYKIGKIHVFIFMRINDECKCNFISKGVTNNNFNYLAQHL